MTSVEHLRSLWRHASWADARILAALRAAGDLAPAPAIREFSHLLAAEEVWLARIEARAPRVAIWPTLDLAGAESLAVAVGAGYDALLDRLTDADLARPVSYVNSAGQPFDTPVDEILLHVSLHGQYHRGKINLLLRQAESEPAPTDYIAFVRGVPAARTPLGR